jgi:uncharacterized protein YlxP (DUF503 family)
MPSIGVLTLELRLEQSHSLKEKRHVVKSLRDRLHNKFNVSVAEIDYQDLWQRSVLAAVTVSADRVQAERVLQSVEHETASLLGPALAGVSVEWI